ncbi:ATP-binding cassette domain-containing protein [Chengkuizengella axinellae]|uniref:ABC transporter ATP-binding protein n=1 Tax=Chengkuizengella axinellae TaxID=3064388 RepID=A0ABT9IZP4_9BACL|nr:ABC transporter ATP-binding protein [Chengkuizengella sp. 2205SS18-9]MDP5274607.1 ABC transporter ATP-binding protein [Chengkuizengella sp. 2205SS18-9]
MIELIKFIIKLFKIVKKDSYILLIIVIILGLWPVVEILIVREVMTFLTSNEYSEVLTPILKLFVLGSFVIILFSIMPILLEKVKYSIHKKLIDKALMIFEENRYDQLLHASKRNKINSTFKSIDDLKTYVIDGSINLFQTLISALFLSIVILYLNIWSPFIIAIGVFFNFYFTLKAGKLEKKLLNDISEIDRLENDFTKILTDPKNTKEIRIYNNLKSVLSVWEGFFEDKKYKTLQNTVKSSFFELSGGLISKISILCVLGLSLIYLNSGDLTPADITSLLLGSFYLDNLLNMILLQGKRWLGRMDFIKDLDKENNCYDDLLYPVDHSLAVDLQGISYTYPSQKIPAIKNLSMKIKLGEKIAIVGDNAAGKSTLVNIISGLIKPNQGSVFSIKTGGICYQDFVKYKLSIKENVILGDINHKDDNQYFEKIMKTIHADHFVNKLSNKSDELLWPELGGSDISEGQWQKIAIGRGLFKANLVKDSLFILDEPTASLDPRTELHLFENIFETLKNHTILFIVHRLIGCTFADKVVVLDKGEIVGYGNHDELLNSCTKYKKMWESSSSFIKRGEC